MELQWNVVTSNEKGELKVFNIFSIDGLRAAVQKLVVKYRSKKIKEKELVFELDKILKGYLKGIELKTESSFILSAYSQIEINFHGFINWILSNF